MDEIESYLHGERGSENFEKENDMADWEFCLETMKYWEKKIKELQDFVDN